MSLVELRIQLLAQRIELAPLEVADRPDTRRRRLMTLGLDAERAWQSSVNGRGPWWNAGASHMTRAASPSFFAQLGLVSLLATGRRLQSVP